jgi:hypothetical protein
MLNFEIKTNALTNHSAENQNFIHILCLSISVWSSQSNACTHFYFLTLLDTCKFCHLYVVGTVLAILLDASVRQSKDINGLIGNACDQMSKAV